MLVFDEENSRDQERHKPRLTLAWGQSWATIRRKTLDHFWPRLDEFRRITGHEVDEQTSGVLEFQDATHALFRSLTMKKFSSALQGQNFGTSRNSLRFFFLELQFNEEFPKNIQLETPKRKTRGTSVEKFYHGQRPKNCMGNFQF